MPENKNQNNDIVIDIIRSIDDISRMSGRGSRSSVNRDMTYGLNFSGQNQQLTIPNRNTSGMIFFTRPMLNLTYGNLSRNRIFHPWRDAHPKSTLGISRAYLDPISNAIRNPVKDLNGTYYDNDQLQFDSPFVNSTSPFIDCLTNSMMSLSGWQDIRGDTYKSDRGIRNEQWFMYDGIAEINEIYTLDATFRNDQGDTVLLIFLLWQLYMSELRNSIFPYPEFIAMRRLDYNTRIYDFVLDGNQQYLLHWAAGGASVPLNTPFGKIFDYDYSQTFNQGLDQLNISFETAYADYNDIITLYEFNKVTGMFNRDLSLYGYLGTDTMPFKNITDDKLDNIPFGNQGNNDSPDAKWVKLRPNERLRANYLARPLVNLYTKELEWWVKKEDFIRYVINIRFDNDQLANPADRIHREYSEYYGDTRLLKGVK